MSAGNRAIWLNKELDFVTYLDARPEASPTFVCDTREIPEQVGNDFALVVFDPPHVNFGANGNMTKLYGHYTAEQIRELVAKSAKEAHRVSRPNALMAFKWNDHDQKLDKILSLMEPCWLPLFGHHMRNKSKGVTTKISQTYWVMLLRKEV